ncbi:MAG: GAF domain-containing sensor histidine kinase [Candidatus Riflebacteria bacterium]|nr:GAF domain-containing sensor histidine kinase [Candidatus Riflebacteria bacterium]
MPGSAPNTSPHDEVALLKERLDKMAVLLDVAKVMSSERNLDALLFYIAEQVTYVTDADRCSIFLLDAKTHELWSKVALKESREIRFSANVGLVGHTVTTGEILNIVAAYEDARFNRDVDTATGYRTRTILCLPLRNLSGTIVGALEVINKRNGSFTDLDRELMQIFCSQAAVAIESAQLYQEKEKALHEIRHKVRQLDILYSVEKEINLSASIDNFMSTVLQKAADALGAEAGAILVPVGADPHLIIRYTCDQRAETLRGLELGPDEGIAAACFKTRVGVTSNDPARDDQHAARFAEALGVRIRNLIATPLVHDDVLIGVLELVNRKGGRFSREDERILEMIATQVSTAVNRLRLLEEKQRAQRLATIGQMASSIIHDFKNPMAIIRGLGELLLRNQLPEDKRSRFSNIIIAEVDRCVNMTRDILEYCRGEKNFRFQPVGAREFLDDIALVLEHDFDSANIGFERQLDYTGTLVIDVEKMKRVIFNISNNARSVMTAGGIFSVECVQKGADIELILADTGPGIPAEIRNSLFQPFVTMGKKHGTGLGLAIAKEIVEAHGGRIEILDRPGKGAVFSIALPIGGPAAAPPLAAA